MGRGYGKKEGRGICSVYYNFQRCRTCAKCLKSMILFNLHTDSVRTDKGFHFKDEETRTHGDQATCPRLHK